MKNKISYVIIYVIILSNIIFSQNLLKELEVSIKIMDTAISAQPNTAKLIVKSEIPELSFESNKGLIKVDNIRTGEWILTLYPGNQRIQIKADNYISHSNRFTFKKQKAYECLVSEKRKVLFRAVDEKLVEVSFKFNVNDVYCSYNQFAPNRSINNISIFKIPAGEYTFHFKKDGYKTHSRTIKIINDTTFDIALIEDKTVISEYRLPGIAIIISNPPGAEIILDGQKFGNAPSTISGLSPGQHQLELRKSKYYSNFSTIEIEEGKSKNLNLNLLQKFGYLTVLGNPDGSEVFINGKLIGSTPMDRFEVESGEYDVLIKKDLYHNYESYNVVINDGQYTDLEYHLMPSYGSIYILTEPEINAEVFIDGKTVGVTPYTNNRYPSGKYNIEIKKKYYYSNTELITVSDGKTTRRTYLLRPSVGKVFINSKGSNIYLNDTFISKDNTELTLNPGTYFIKLEREGFHTQEKEVMVQAGIDEKINLTLLPKQGSVSIYIEPPDYNNQSEVIINGKSYGQAPVIRAFPVGEHKITVKVIGKTYNRNISLKENQDISVNINVNDDDWAVSAKKTDITPIISKPVSDSKVRSDQVPKGDHVIIWDTKYLGIGVAEYIGSVKEQDASIIKYRAINSLIIKNTHILGIWDNTKYRIGSGFQVGDSVSTFIEGHFRKCIVENITETKVKIKYHAIRFGVLRMITKNVSSKQIVYQINQNKSRVFNPSIEKIIKHPAIDASDFPFRAKDLVIYYLTYPRSHVGIGEIISIDKFSKKLFIKGTEKSKAEGIIVNSVLTHWNNKVHRIGSNFILGDEVAFFDEKNWRMGIVKDLNNLIKEAKIQYFIIKNGNRVDKTIRIGYEKMVKTLK